MTRTSILLLVLGVGPAICQTTGWKLNWSDEFSGAAGSAPDSSKWAYDTGAGGWGNNELENYTTSTANSFQDGRGHLVIQALNVNGGYTSARLKTQSTFSFSYGKVEARIKMPYAQGIWPFLRNKRTTWPRSVSPALDAVPRAARPLSGCLEPTLTRSAGPTVAKSTSWKISVLRPTTPR